MPPNLKCSHALRQRSGCRGEQFAVLLSIWMQKPLVQSQISLEPYILTSVLYSLTAMLLPQ